jgi:hypothetical protein
MSHTTGRRASDEHSRSIDTVVGNRVLNHGRDTLGVSSAVVSEGSSRRDIEAFSAPGRIRVDDDEAMLVRETGVGRAGEVSLGGARAVVDGDDQRRVGCNVRGLVDEHPDVVWVRAKARHLLQLPALRECAAKQHGGSGDCRKQFSERHSCLSSLRNFEEWFPLLLPLAFIHAFGRCFPHDATEMSSPKIRDSSHQAGLQIEVLLQNRA